MERLKIEMIECKISKSLKDLNIEKGIEIGEIKETDIKLKKLKIPKTITKLVTPEKYLQQILRHKLFLKVDILKQNFISIKSPMV